jgi:hypothetical protein
VFRLLEELTLTGHDVLDCLEELPRSRLIETETIEHPAPEVGCRPWERRSIRVVVRVKLSRGHGASTFRINRCAVIAQVR